MNLAEALTEFSKTRSSELGDAIETLGREAIEGFTAPTLKKNLAFHEAWKQLAADPTKRSWCLDTIIDKLPKLEGERWCGDKMDAVTDRIETLHKMEPDPRISRAMLALYELRSPVVDDLAAVECMIRHADDLTGSSPLIAQMMQDTEYLEPILKNVTFLKAVVLDSKIKAKAASVKPIKRDTSALFAAIYASPDADEPREILADALQEAGDPRGEFIALQLREHRGDPSEELRDRAQELVAQHGKTWLGPLRPITYRAEMRRGFLQRLELAGSWSSKNWAGLAKEPMLSTVEELSTGQATARIYSAFLAGPIAKTIRTVEVYDTSIWAVVTATPMPRLRHLVNGYWGRSTNANERFKTLIAPWLADHPQITQLTVTDTKSADSIPKPIAARLTDLTVWCSQTAGAKMWAKWPKLHTLTITPSEAKIRFVRDGKTEVARVILERIWGGAGPKLTLPKSIQRIELTNNVRVAKLMEQTYQRRYEVAVVKMPSGTITGVK
ncbi:MAG: TIGR02996 domain-containing protein [Kofleriaceae bacterium]